MKNRWRCGPVAYAAEFVEAFEWWLREKAEWWLERKKAGGPVELDDWAGALWKDARVQAAWEVAAENYALLHAEGNGDGAFASMWVPVSDEATGAGAAFVDDPPEALMLPGVQAVQRPRQQVLSATASARPVSFSDFRQAFKRIIDDEALPENIPWAVPYDDLEKQRRIKVPAKVKSVRGKLNVPRERFHLRGKTQYLWAGLQFRD